MKPAGTAHIGIRFFIDTQYRVAVSQVIEHILPIVHFRVSKFKYSFPSHNSKAFISPKQRVPNMCEHTNAE